MRPSRATIGEREAERRHDRTAAREAGGKSGRQQQAGDQIQPLRIAATARHHLAQPGRRLADPSGGGNPDRRLGPEPQPVKPRSDSTALEAASTRCASRRSRSTPAAPPSPLLHARSLLFSFTSVRSPPRLGDVWWGLNCFCVTCLHA